MHSFNRESTSYTHIYGLLHALVALCRPEIDTTTIDTSIGVNDIEQPVPITSLECKWNKLCQQKDSKAQVSDVTFKKHIYGR